MRWQRDQAAQNAVAIRWRERHAVRDRCHVQRATCDVPKSTYGPAIVATCEYSYNVREPLLGHRGVSEETLELGRQRADVQERFIHVKHNDPLTSCGSYLALGGRWSRSPYAGGRS
jgi:hypothetical protein